MTTIRDITLTPSRHKGDADQWDSPMILRVRCRYTRRVERLGVFYIGPNGAARRSFGGPILPGPHAGLYPHATIIDNHGGTGAESARMRADGLEFDAAPGDQFRIGGVLFELRDDRPYDYPQLVVVNNKNG